MTATPTLTLPPTAAEIAAAVDEAMREWYLAVEEATNAVLGGMGGLYDFDRTRKRDIEAYDAWCEELTGGEHALWADVEARLRQIATTTLVRFAAEHPDAARTEPEDD